MSVFKEAGNALRKNLVVSVATVLTVAISLSFLGTALLVRKTVTEIQDIFYTKIEISVFLKEDITSKEKSDIKNDLEKNTLVESLVYESKDEAYRRFSLQYKDQPDLLKNVTKDALPESFRVKLKDPTNYLEVASILNGKPGVDQVQDSRDFLKDLFTTLRGMRNAAIAIAVLQLVAATLLIANSVRLAAYTRRRETRIMRLVGATRLYIQLPFLLEGLLAGTLGAGIALGFLFLGKKLLLEGTLKPLFANGFIPVVDNADILSVFPSLLLIGWLVSSLASVLALRKYSRS